MRIRGYPQGREGVTERIPHFSIFRRYAVAKKSSKQVERKKFTAYFLDASDGALTTEVIQALEKKLDANIDLLQTLTPEQYNTGAADDGGRYPDFHAIKAAVHESAIGFVFIASRVLTHISTVQLAAETRCKFVMPFPSLGGDDTYYILSADKV